MTHRVIPLLVCLAAAVALGPGCEEPSPTPGDSPGSADTSGDDQGFGGTGDPVGSDDSRPADWSLTTATQAPDFDTTAETVGIEVDGAISVVGTRGDDVLVGTSVGLYRVSSGTLEAFEVYSEDADAPDTTGAVACLAALPDGETLVVAEHGIFHTYEHVLLVSPLTEALAGVDVRAVSAPSDDETWVASADGLLRVTGDALEAWSLPGTTDSPTDVAALADVVMILDDGDLYQLDRADSSVVGSPLAAADGLTALAAAGDQGFIATAAGVVQRLDAETWYRHELGAVTSMAPTHAGGLLAATAVGLFEVSVSAAQPATVEAVSDWDGADASAGLGADIDGHVWVGGASELTQVLVGSPLSFATDVEPLLSAQCGYCHDAGLVAPARDFGDYDVVVSMADTILERVTLGLMPPAPTTMATADIDVLIRWYEGGMNP